MRFDLRARVECYPGWGTPEEHRERLTRLFQELIPLSGRQFAGGDRLCGPVRLTLAEVPPASVVEDLDKLTRRIVSVSPFGIIEFRSEVEADPAGFEGRFWTTPDQMPYSLRHAAIQRMDEAIATLSLCVCLAQPDEIRFSAPEFSPEPSPEFRSSVPHGELRRGVVIASEIGWPKVRRLPLKQVVEWMERLPGWSEGIGRGPVGRAVAALSQAIAGGGDGYDSPLSLLWGMVGLEALYCRGKEGLRAQVAERTQLLLGPLESHKRRLGRLYDYRSAFVHGSVDVPFAHRGRADDDEVMQFVWRSDDEASLATITLLASIQELIVRDWHELEFTTHIVGHRTA